MRYPIPMKWLGLALSFVIILLAGESCRCNVGNGEFPMAMSGPEDWAVDGAVFHVERTYYVRRGIQEVLYVIEYSPSEKSVLFGMNDEAALRIAFPLMKHAYESHSYERTQFKALRGTGPAIVAIAVDLVARDGERVQGYRIVQTIGEIVRRLKGNQDGQP
jgi:hypothetical protein